MALGLPAAAVLGEGPGQRWRATARRVACLRPARRSRASYDGAAPGTKWGRRRDFRSFEFQCRDHAVARRIEEVQIVEPLSLAGRRDVTCLKFAAAARDAEDHFPRCPRLRDLRRERDLQRVARRHGDLQAAVCSRVMLRDRDH